MIEAKVIHERLRPLQALGNETRLEFLDALRALHDDRLCFELGYSSFHQYCDRELGLAKSTSYEYLRVGKALGGLPGLRAMVTQGELSWDQARHAARVANPDTEVSWIELAWQVPVAEFLAEARDAARNGRSAPRARRNGLPNLMTKFSIDMTLEDKERTRVAFGLVAGALGEPEEDSAGGARPTLLRWVDAVIAGKVPIAARTTEEESGTRPTPAPWEADGTREQGDPRTCVQSRLTPRSAEQEAVLGIAKFSKLQGLCLSAGGPYVPIFIGWRARTSPR